MILTEEIKQILKNYKIYDINKLKNLTRKDLKNMKLNNNQINQVIIYLQLNGLDIKKSKKNG